MDVAEANAYTRKTVTRIVEHDQNIMEFHCRNLKVIKRVHIDHTNKKVAVLAGVSGGHEHALVGYVGQGMLTATVVEDVLKSPQTEDIVQAAEAVTGPMGVLLIARNWEDEVENFTKAMGELEKRGLKVKLLPIMDECSVMPTSKRRGLAGTILAIKVAGECAESGFNLENVYKASYNASLSLGTIGVSLPIEQFPLELESQISPTKMQFGIALDGEAGMPRDTIPLVTLVCQMVDQILSMIKCPEVPYKEAHLKRLCALMINPLGPSDIHAMHYISKVAVSHLRKKNLEAWVVCMGPFFPSLSKLGFSISIMRDSAGSTTSLKAHTNAPFWTATGNLFQVPIHRLDPELTVRIPNSIATNGVRPHDVTLRSLVQGAQGKKMCWIKFGDSYIASDFLQKIVKGLLKMIGKYENVQKFIKGILTIDNTVYTCPYFDEPYFINMEGSESNEKDVYYKALRFILSTIKDLHEIHQSLEFDNFCKLLKSSDHIRMKAKIRNNIFLYNGVTRVHLVEEINRRLLHVQLSLAAKGVMQSESGLQFVEKMEVLDNTSKLYGCFYYDPRIQCQGNTSSYINNKWETIVKFARNLFGHWTKCLQLSQRMYVVAEMLHH